VGARRDTYDLLFRADYHEGGKRQPPTKVQLQMDTHGWVAGLPESDFSSPRELGAVLAKSPQCQECMVKQYFRYIAGRGETPADYAVIRRTFDDFRASGYHFKELMVSLIRNREFPPEEATVDAARNY
jgi:hypothetical protein